MSISWYVIENLQPPLRQQLMMLLENPENIEGSTCLLDDSCSVHPLCPIACRQFNILDKACADGENAFHTRKMM